jgi:tRNA(Ile)-lysidine synthase TilS/MesJ
MEQPELYYLIVNGEKYVSEKVCNDYRELCKRRNRVRRELIEVIKDNKHITKEDLGYEDLVAIINQMKYELAQVDKSLKVIDKAIGCTYTSNPYMPKSKPSLIKRILSFFKCYPKQK